MTTCLASFELQGKINNNKAIFSSKKSGKAFMRKRALKSRIFCIGKTFNDGKKEAARSDLDANQLGSY